MATGQQLMEIGTRLVEMNNSGNSRLCVSEMYAQDCVSAEPITPQGKDSNCVQGVEAIFAKHDWWESAFDVHSTSAEGPFVHGDDRFCVIYQMDITEKQSGERSQMREIATYFVNQDNKICREEFAYALG